MDASVRRAKLDEPASGDRVAPNSILPGLPRPILVAHGGGAALAGGVVAEGIGRAIAAGVGMVELDRETLRRRTPTIPNRGATWLKQTA